MQDIYRKQADDFISNESQFHLGFLPTEQSNPLTTTLSEDFAGSISAGVRCLQRVDREVLEMAKKVFASDEYKHLIGEILHCLKNDGRLIFSGCGATGRLSILLEAMWRNSCKQFPAAEQYASQTASIMTGGDYALVRSVEFFEDFASFGRRQVQELAICEKDLFIAITEGGETSSVLGSVLEAADRGAKVFLLFNNPADLLAEKLERCREVINDPRVTVLDLHCGPMALAGSTRMQATTSEQLVAGAALESALHQIIGKKERDYIADFETLLESLESEKSVKAISDYINFEADIYRNQGKITYFAEEFLLDIFTDTTERSPTFMLPPFRRNDDKKSPQPWAFVKNPLLRTEEAWQQAMQRPLRCLDWQKTDYEQLGAGEKISSAPPALSSADLLQFSIGKENLQERYDSGKDAAVLVAMKRNSALENEYSKISQSFSKNARIAINLDLPDSFNIPAVVHDGALELMSHLALKLVLNTISTSVMTILGRVTGNWMSWVDCTNKKLLDRGARLLVEIANIDYRSACEHIFAALDEIKEFSGEKPSAVQIALKKLQK